MPASPNADNYTLGRGIVYFDKLVSGAYEGERDLGNTSSFNISQDMEKLEHFSSRSGLKAKDKIVVTQITPGLGFSLDEINVENVALMFMGQVQSIVQAAADALTETLSVVTGNRFFALAVRKIGVWKLEYDGGTALFARDEVVTGGTSTATATVLRVVGDATSGTLYLKSITGTFDDDETLTGDVLGDADVNGVAAFDATDLAISDAAANTTFYDKTTDFVVDADTGRVKIVKDGAIDVAAAAVDVEYACEAATYTKVQAFKETSIEGRLRFVPDNPVGNNLECNFHRVNLTPGGEAALIGDEWQAFEFTGEILKDETGNPDSPYGDIITEDTV